MDEITVLSDYPPGEYHLPTRNNIVGKQHCLIPQTTKRELDIDASHERPRKGCRAW